MDIKVMELNCAVVNNVWGRRGQSSLVARLKAAADMTFTPDPHTHYAQLWLGDHGSQATAVKLPGGQSHKGTVTLREWLELHPEQVGKPDEFGSGALPFLLKILSIRTPLALQVHPGKAMAEQLHKQEPDVFDPNHKPEMAIALTPFVALVGFRPVEEVVRHLDGVAELREAMGEQTTQRLHLAAAAQVGKKDNSAKELSAQALKSAFSRVVDTESADVRLALQKLVIRIKHDSVWSSPECKAILHMDDHFPGDVGALAVFLLNLVHLEPGEAIFIDAMVPHAYLSGDCIECQASSDNVLRAAFTHKRRDLDLMCSGMTFAGQPGAEFKVAPEVTTTPTLRSELYPSPYPDFAVTKYQIKAGASLVHIPALPSASICIVIEGQGRLFWSNKSRNSMRDVVCVSDQTHCEAGYYKRNQASDGFVDSTCGTTYRANDNVNEAIKEKNESLKGRSCDANQMRSSSNGITNGTGRMNGYSGNSGSTEVSGHGNGNNLVNGASDCIHRNGLATDSTHCHITADSTHRNGDTDDTHYNGVANGTPSNGFSNGTHLNNTEDSAHYNGVAGDTHCNGNTDDTHCNGFASSTHLNNTGDSTHCNGVADDTPSNGFSNGTHLNNTEDSAHYNGIADDTPSNGVTNGAHLNNTEDSAYYNGIADDTPSNGVANGTHLNHTFDGTKASPLNARGIPNNVRNDTTIGSNGATYIIDNHINHIPTSQQHGGAIGCVIEHSPKASRSSSSSSMDLQPGTAFFVAADTSLEVVAPADSGHDSHGEGAGSIVIYRGHAGVY